MDAKCLLESGHKQSQERVPGRLQNEQICDLGNGHWKRKCPTWKQFQQQVCRIL